MTFVMIIQKQWWIKLLVPKMNHGVAPHCTSSHCIFTTMHLITPLYIITLLILKSTYNTSACWSLTFLSRKGTYVIELQAEPAPLIIERRFDLRESFAYKLLLYRPEYLEDNFSKNQVSSSLKTSKTSNNISLRW